MNLNPRSSLLFLFLLLFVKKFGIISIKTDYDDYLYFVLLFNRCVIMELASSLVEGAQEDLIDLIYTFIKHTFQV